MRLGWSWYLPTSRVLLSSPTRLIANRRTLRTTSNGPEEGLGWTKSNSGSFQQKLQPKRWICLTIVTASKTSAYGIGEPCRTLLSRFKRYALTTTFRMLMSTVTQWRDKPDR